MSLAKDLFDEIRDGLRLSERVSGIAAATEKMEQLIEKRFDRLEDKVQELVPRIRELEVKVDLLQKTIKGEVLAEISAEVATVKTALSLMPRLEEHLEASASRRELKD